LEAVAEAALLLWQMKEERCPICGAPAEYHDREHQETDATQNDVSIACASEANKIRALESDLRTTLADNAADIERLNSEIAARRAELETTTNEIQRHVESRVQRALAQLRNYQADLDKRRRAIELQDLVGELERMLWEAENPKSAEPPDGVRTSLRADEAENFCKEVEALLRAWHFPGLDRVTFSERDQDVVISGRPRASHGKGVRAITHAAFNLAILNYCHARAMPHQGLVIIDSPLVVYREPDTGEGSFPLAVKDAFYRSLATGFASSQVVIIENDEPPKDIEAHSVVIKFTGTSTGRFGFIPTSASNNYVQ
jgi:hypothetical protein